MCVGGIRTSMMTSSGRCSATRAEQLVGVATAATTSIAAVGEHPGQAVPQQHRVLGDHDSHGSSAVMMVGPPGGLSMQRAVHRGDPVRQPGQPAARRAEAPPRAVVGDGDPQPVAAPGHAHLGLGGPGRA